MPDEIRRQVSNYADDIAGGVAGEQNAPATLDKLYAMTEELLKVLDQNQITVKPTKARIGFPSATFGGYEIGRGVRSVAEKNVQPILEMQTPKDVSEVRRVLGIFVQMQNMVPNYTTIARPLTRLTGKKAWRWSTDEDTAFQTLRNLCAGRPSLSNPDYNRIQHLDVDASNDGWGAMLYHVTANDEKEAICYFSGAWDDAMRMRPIYYREAAALYRSLAKARYYIDANVHETVVHTDHMPLKWVKHSRRGPITEWVLEETAGMTYRIEYIAGEANTVADATSRAPVVQASRMSTGIERLFRELLARLPSGFQEHKTMWVWAEKDTTEVARMVQRWRSAGSPLLVKSPGVHMYTVSWDFAVVAPSGERAPLVCANLFESGRPFACLVPSDLVSWIPVKGASSQRDERLQLLLDGAQKIVSLDSSLTWIVGGVSEPFQHHVFVSEAREIPGSDGRDDETVGSIANWIVEQKQQREALAQEAIGEVVTMENGLILDVQPGDTAKILVPQGRRQALVKHAHETSQHQGWRKVLVALKKQYHWKGMSSEVKRIVQSCDSCQTVKAKRNLAHGQFSSVTYDGPRTAYGIDFYGVQESERGYKWILTVMDLYSHEVHFVPTKTREAGEALRALIREVFNRYGIPMRIVSDQAQEFVSKLMQGMCAALGIEHITTLGYNARGNAQCERVHAFLGQCLTRLPAEHRATWENYTTEFEFAHNTTHHSTIGCTPFQLAHGTEARTLTSALAMHEYKDTDVKGYFARLRAAADVYRDVAARTMREARLNQNRRLNDVTRKRQYEVGDRVFYIRAHSCSRCQVESETCKSVARTYAGRAEVEHNHV